MYFSHGSDKEIEQVPQTLAASLSPSIMRAREIVLALFTCQDFFRVFERCKNNSVGGGGAFKIATNGRDLEDRWALKVKARWNES